MKKIAEIILDKDSFGGTNGRKLVDLKTKEVLKRGILMTPLREYAKSLGYEFKKTIKHLSINPHEDSIYPITWVSENVKTCLINRTYKDEYGPVFGKAIYVKLPDSDDWHVYAANDQGWLSACDVYGDVSNLPEIPIMDGILEVEADVNQWLEEKD